MTNDLAVDLNTYFGFDSFRHGQLEAIRSLLAGQNTLVVMPTGSGKSLIYQLTALKLTGLTLVISPLIALMKDQVDSLERRNISAAYINSTLLLGEQNRRLERMARGGYQLVYVAPERLRSRSFLEALRRQQVALLVVDEAHCISEWGHDFRPDYLHIAAARNALGNPLTIGLTATATPKVQEDIVRLLGLGNVEKIVTGFNRPNLAFEVRYTQGLAAKLKTLRTLLKNQDHGGVIIYAGTRHDAEEIVDFVRQAAGVQAEYYHAGLATAERTCIQEAFLTGALPLVAATNAFGMGVDRPDVRLVVHYSLPGSLEAYYQEAGRAGRDGKPAQAVMLYDPKDRALQGWFIENSKITIEELHRLYQTVQPGENRLTSENLSLLTSFHETKVRLGLAELERAGVLERLGDQGSEMLVRRSDWNVKAVQTVASQSETIQLHRRTQLERMVVYAEANTCRRVILLSHFGDHSPAEAPDCCDNCRTLRPTRVSYLATSTPDRTASAPVDAADLQQAQRVALILLDTVRRLKTQVGRTKLAQILHGSQAADIRKFHYDQNVYYGRLAVFKQVEIEGLIEQLIDGGYFKVVGGKYPVLALTSQGEAALRDKVSIPLKIPRTYTPKEIENKKAERQAGGSYEVTGQLFAEGLTPAKIAQERGLTLGTIYQHLARWIAAGKIPIEAVVPADVLEQVERAIQHVGNVDALWPIKELLPDTIDYSMIRCVVEGWKLKQPHFRDGSSAAIGDGKVVEAIFECVQVFPGQLPRSGIAKLLVGSKSERVEKYRTQPLFNCLPGYQRGDVMRVIDGLLLSRQLAKDEKGYLILGTEAVSNPDEEVDRFLSQPHPRRLDGPWHSGWALDFHSRFAGTDWSRSSFGELAYRLKYQGDLTALPALVDQAAGLVAEHPDLIQVDVILPVPPSTPRPVDPMSAFAEALGKRLKLAVARGLVKSRPTSPQKEMHTLAQKHANVAGAFSLQGSVHGQRILVVDDLYDSGATLEEITWLLQHSGAIRVCVLTLTRTIHSDA